MGKLIYSTICSLDGYVADERGEFDWSAPDEEVHSFVNELERPIGIYLYGRRLYDVMTVWETLDTSDEPSAMQDYATLWRAAEKIVFSTTLEEPSTTRTRLEHDFDPEAIRRLKADSSRDLGIGGPHLAAQAISAGLVDEFQLFLSPVIIGGGTSALPDGVRLGLELLEQRRFGNGVVYLRYRNTDTTSTGPRA